MIRGAAQGFRTLLDAGVAPMRLFGVRQRKHLEQLVAGGFVEVRRSGGGQAVSVLNRPGLEAWLSHHFPAGLDAGSADGEATDDRRTRGVRVYRDSKAFAGTGLHSLQIRLAGEGSAPWDAVAVFLDDGAAPCRVAWPMSAPVVGLAENRTFFQRADLSALRVDALVAYDGRLSDRLLRWCSAQSGCTFVLMPDYDYVGLDDYRRASDVLGPAVSLFVPAVLEDLMGRFGKRDLVAIQGQLADAVALFVASRPADAALQRVHRAIRSLALGLEQEALLIETAAPGEAGG